MSNSITRRELLAAAGALGVSNAAPSRPNILFILADQVRACDLSMNGGRNVRTPNLDKLASQGVTFTNALSTYPLCTPYRAMLQTGRYPSNSGGVMNWINLPSTGQSLGDVFSKGGYDTGLIGKWHLAAGFRAGSLNQKEPPPKHPESEFVPPGPARMGWQYWAVNNFSFDFLKKPFYYRDTPEKQFWPGFETDSQTDDAIQFMKKRANSPKPFFLMVSPHPPHAPWRVDQTLPRDLDRIPKELHWRPNVKGRRDRPMADPRCYFAMLGNLDDNVGRLMQSLDDSGLADNTIVIFASDHGEMLGAHGRYDKMVPYAESVDVPLIMRWPKRIRAGSKSDALYTPIDHFPTLASVCGLSTPSIVNGMDLSAHMLGAKGRERDAALMMNFVSDWDFPETNTKWPEWRGLRTKQYTYVRWLNGAEEFYDNAADPYQMTNLFDGRSAPAAMTALRKRLPAELEQANDKFMPGTAYGEWFNKDRNCLRTATGPVG